MDYPKPTKVIGGVHDGETHAVAAPHLRLADPMKFADADFSSPNAFIAKVEDLKASDYRPMPHAIGGVKFSVWVPAKMTDEEAGNMIFGRIAKMWAEALASK